MILQGHPDLQFVPTGILDRILDRATVGRVLEQHKRNLDVDISALESFICSNARRIFAILAWADSEPLIEQFYLHGFVDEQLPVRVHLEVNDDDLYEATSFRLGNISIDRHPFNYHQWTDRNIETFCDNDQWPFLSPVFEEDKFRYKFHERTRMPFVEERHRSLKESYFSVVEEWRIHRDHIRTPRLIVRPSSLC